MPVLPGIEQAPGFIPSGFGFSKLISQILERGGRFGDRLIELLTLGQQAAARFVERPDGGAGLLLLFVGLLDLRFRLSGALVEFGSLQPQRGEFPGHCRADRKSTRLNSSHLVISYAVFCLKKKKKKE